MLRHAGLQIAGAVETRLLVASDENLQGSVLDGLVGEDSEAGGDAHTVISTEGGVRGLR